MDFDMISQRMTDAGLLALKNNQHMRPDLLVKAIYTAMTEAKHRVNENAKLPMPAQN